jgi:hypothetical protein
MIKLILNYFKNRKIQKIKEEIAYYKAKEDVFCNWRRVNYFDKKDYMENCAKRSKLEVRLLNLEKT